MKLKRLLYQLFYLKIFKRRPGFTVIEILVTTVLVTGILNVLVLLSGHFNRSFTKGEELGAAVQEAGMFLAMLRNDLINAVPDAKLPLQYRLNSIKITPTELTFFVSTEIPGVTAKVAYLYKPKGTRGSILRSFNDASPKTIINGLVASLSWSLNTERIALKSSSVGTVRIWVDVYASIGGGGKMGSKNKAVVLAAKLFPTRLAKLLSAQLANGGMGM